mgnify:CR=1
MLGDSVDITIMDFEMIEIGPPTYGFYQRKDFVAMICVQNIKQPVYMVRSL